jgi:hypothetical protein
MIIFYCLRFQIPSTWRARHPYLYPQEQAGPVIPPGTGFPFVASYDSQDYSGDIRPTRSVESYSVGADTQRTPPATPLSPRTCLPNRSIATSVRVTYRDPSSFDVCGHYLATAVSLALQFLPWANMPQYWYSFRMAAMLFYDLKFMAMVY